MTELKRHKHAVGQSAYHFVWRPKYNVSVFSHPYPRKVCEEALRAAAAKWGIEIYEMEVMPDHVHLFAEVPPTITVSFALQVLKGSSARAFFKKCTIWKKYFQIGGKAAHLWSPGKFFRSVGCVTAEAVENYIRNSNNWDFTWLERKQTKLNSFNPS